MFNEDELSLSEKIKKIRQNHQLSQAQMADKMGMSEQSYGRWERDDKRITVLQLQKFSKKLNMKVSDIIDLPDGVLICDNHTSENSVENSVQNGSAAFFIVNNYVHNTPAESDLHIENERLRQLLEQKEQQLADNEKWFAAQNQQIALMTELLEHLKNK